MSTDNGSVSRETEQRDDDGRDHDDTQDDTQDTEGQDDDTQDDDGGELQQTFNREYVEKLRSKSANYRLKMKESQSRVTELERALWTERVKRLDMVVDPDAVPYNADLLDDETATVEAIESLLEAKPYLRKRKANGDIGQHDARGRGGDGFTITGALRNNAG